MSKKVKEKKSKKHVCNLVCPFCGCKVLLNENTKVKRFPKVHLFKFDCGFAFLYNDDKKSIFTDVDWACMKKSENKVSEHLDLNKSKNKVGKLLIGEVIKYRNSNSKSTKKKGNK